MIFNPLLRIADDYDVLGFTLTLQPIGEKRQRKEGLVASPYPWLIFLGTCVP